MVQVWHGRLRLYSTNRFPRNALTACRFVRAVVEMSVARGGLRLQVSQLIGEAGVVGRCHEEIANSFSRDPIVGRVPRVGF